MICSAIDVESGSPVEIPSDQPLAPDSYVVAGFLDIQVNGFAGVDYNCPATTDEQIAQSLRALFSTGVTRFFPTVITGSPDDMSAALRNLARARETLSDGEAIEGFHVEGPHISPDEGPRGAHPRQWVRPPDFDEFLRWQDAAGGRVRIVTLSPEWPRAPRYIEQITAAGVVASIGHTQASTEQIGEAVAAGATLSTHLGNGSHSMLRRHPNYIWDQLADDRLMAGFIVDGIHLDASFLRVALRAKTLDRAVLVTDASAPAAAAPGRYRLGEQDVDHTPEGRVVLAGTDRLAGSALTMARGVDNLMRLAGLSLPDAIRLATRNPANAIRIPDRGDRIVFRLNPGVEILRTYVGGREVYRRPGDYS
jgi:N-acetylglucosamine-6-phosphate deacetylase